MEVYQNVSNNIKKSLDTLQTHVDNLSQAAERYETLEVQQTQVVNSLRTDSIFG